MGSEAVNRRTDNTMATKRTKGKTMICKKHYTENKRLSNTNITKSGSEFSCSERVSSTFDSRRFSLVTNPVISH